MIKKIIFVFVLIMMSSINSALAKPHIVIVATGGTIAGAAKDATGSSYTAGKLTAENLISHIPGLDQIAKISTEQFCQIGSQDMDNQTWLNLAKRVDELARDSDIDGIVITHGTDTMEETAYFLNLVIQTKKPIILVGAMHPATSLGADGPLNLYNAVTVASLKEAKNKGVLVIVGENIFSARDITKTHTINVSALSSTNSGPIGLVNYKTVKFYYEPIRTHTHNSDFDIRKIKHLPKVEIVYGYANQNSAIIDFLVKEEKVEGIIQAGVGDGNVYKTALISLINASKNGVAIVRSSRTNSGFVVRNSEIDDDKYNFITADNLNPSKSRILLMLALTQNKDPKKIQEIFNKY